MQSFGQGLQAGTPIGASALASAGPVAPPLSDPPPAPTPHVAQTFPSSGHTPAFEVPPHPPAAEMPPPSYVPPSAAGGAYLAGPTAAPPPITGAAAPVGPLPSYGADIRPATPAAPTAPASPPPAAPASAPASPSSSVGQPAVVRQSASPATPPPTPAVVSEQAVGVTAGGAIAGATSAQTTARTRLQNLVDTVARQEPRLHWAAGERPDHTTVLVTDLACGWIPPHVDIPVGMRLLGPARRRGDVEALLGEVTVTASYIPGQHLPQAEDIDPVLTSPRARHGLVVDELGWELGQATKWRDGLPRLAHTLARAATRDTGVAPAEYQALREHLATVAERVLRAYPDDLDGAAIENWQLLATIAALVNGSTAVANYHFAWFQALSRTAAGGALP
ncbi:DUF5632 domain-containing protein [Mycobacterium sp. pUA109]|uniref:DUF5632 domain-containing protein n=1 Tax=Mycobacterium sp. pUA109 TaxID=3238982 RepID=UPI00351B5210